MTDPDPRTDLAGYLGLTEEQARICRQSAEGGYTGIRGKVGARLIEQDQARADEPDDGPIPVTYEMLKAYWRATQAADLDTMADAHRAGLQAVLDLIASTVPEPVEGPPGTVPVTMWLDDWVNENGPRWLRCPDGRLFAHMVDDWWREHGVPVPDPPAPPWTDPWGLGLTEEEARNLAATGSGAWVGPNRAAISKFVSALSELFPEDGDRG